MTRTAIALTFLLVAPALADQIAGHTMKRRSLVQHWFIVVASAPSRPQTGHLNTGSNLLGSKLGIGLLTCWAQQGPQDPGAQQDPRLPKGIPPGAFPLRDPPGAFPLGDPASP